MNEKFDQYDFVKAELEYRFGRTRADIAGRRTRRLFSGRGRQVDRGDATFTSAR